MSGLTDTLLQAVKASGQDADEWVRNIAVDPSAVEEVMGMFSNLDVNQVKEILARNGSSVDKSLPELFSLYNETTRVAGEKRRQKKLQEAADVLQKGFAGLDRVVIEEAVSRHGGDMEQASRELLSVLAEQQELEMKRLLDERQRDVQEKQEKEKQARARLVEHCVATFDVLSRDEVVEILRSTNYDVTKAVASLREKSQQRKVRSLQHVFSGVPLEHIKTALEHSEYDVGKAFALLSGSKNDASPVSSVSPPEPEEDALKRTILEAKLAEENKVVSLSEKDVQDMLVTMLRDAAGPASGADQIPKAAPNHELESVADQSLPKSLEVALTVTSGKNTFSYGSSVKVTVAVTGGDASPYDWIGLFDAQTQDNSAPLAWVWHKVDAEASLAFPSYGTFQVRYLRKVDGIVKCLAQTAKLQCGPGVTLRAEPRETNWIVHYQWDDSTERPSTRSWVGLYAVGTPETSYLAFNYLPAGSASGSITFDRRYKNGSYEFRFFPYKFQGPLSSSNVILVKQDDEVVLTRDGASVTVKTTLASIDPKVNQKCWVGVFHKNDSRPNSYRRYAYITDASQTFTFKTPVHAGNYVSRIYDEQSRLLAQSVDVVIV